MREFVLATCMSLHSIAAVAWVGGIIFLIGVALPALKSHGGPQIAEVMKNIGKRFTPMANASIGILLVTGCLLSILPSGDHRVHQDHFFWAKLAVFGVMVSIHCWRLLVLPGKVARAETESQKSRLQQFSLSLVRVNLGLGVIALLFTAAIGV